MHPLVAAALADVGRVRETAPNVVPGISDGRPWCSRWLSGHLVALGIVPVVVWSALDLMRLLGKLGHSLDHRGPFQPGDVVAWRRGSVASGKGHVEVVERVEGDVLHTIGGNVRGGVRRSRRKVAIVKFAARVPG